MPLVYVFEEARRILVDQTVNIKNIYYAFMLKFNLFNNAIGLFYYSFNQARKKGTLINIGE